MIAEPPLGIRSLLFRDERRLIIALEKRGATSRPRGPAVTDYDVARTPLRARTVDRPFDAIDHVKNLPSAVAILNSRDVNRSIANVT
jgi:hypothetical protein